MCQSVSTGIRSSLGSMLAAAAPLSASSKNFRYALRSCLRSLFSFTLAIFALCFSGYEWHREM